jgi:hypothetical protein
LNNQISLQEVAALMEEILQGGGEVAFVPGGSSMLPMLRDRQDKIILVQPPEKLHKYDITLYRRKNGKFVLHRVIDVNGNTYVLCGDYQWQREYGVRHDQVLAVVKAFYRGKTYVDCSHNKAYRLYCFIWTGLLPVRRLFCRLKGWADRAGRKLFSR